MDQVVGAEGMVLGEGGKVEAVVDGVRYKGWRGKGEGWVYLESEDGKTRYALRIRGD